MKVNYWFQQVTIQRPFVLIHFILNSPPLPHQRNYYFYLLLFRWHLFISAKGSVSPEIVCLYRSWVVHLLRGNYFQYSLLCCSSFGSWFGWNETKITCLYPWRSISLLRWIKRGWERWTGQRWKQELKDF